MSKFIKYPIYILTAIILMMAFAQMVSAETISQLNLPIERTDGTPIQCELSRVNVYVNGDCARYTVLDVDGRESDFSLESCGGLSADLNMDGVVNAADLAIMKSQFFMAL